ncbi:hypothetical protein CDAR_305081 [Caerostris darwini]|uniref:Uncharacterized protein n=1 Tax=Caerostris darwini TaxID=1538125 RepID=A0AAV4RCN3_9ARAC|nr:hypothetical protein CDAR_305081 [Caerostris darwini]
MCNHVNKQFGAALQKAIQECIAKDVTFRGSSSSISKATFGIHTRENPFPTLAKSMPKTISDFGSMVQDSREGKLGVVWNRGIFFLHVKSNIWNSYQREPFPSSPTATSAKSIPETVSDFGPMVQDSREGSLGWNKGAGVGSGATIKSRDPKGPKINTAGSSSSISKATFGIHTRENPFPTSPTPTLAKSMPETASDFGSMVQDSREGKLVVRWNQGLRGVDDKITRSQRSKSASLLKSFLLLLF